MDPDMVRQQEEAELEQRARPPMKAKDVPLKDVPDVEAVLAAVAEQAAPPPPAAIETPSPALATPGKPPRWRVRAQALFSGSALAALAALTAAARGANQGFSTDEQLWMGGIAAALLAVIYGVVLSVSGNNCTNAGSGR